MALKIFEKFSPRANPADVDYPYGSIKNESVPGAKDGTPLDASWGNDMLGFTDALLDEAGITPNGLPDTVQSSQRLGALHAVFDVYGTVADVTTGKFKVGKRVSVTDRANSVFLIVAGGTPNGLDILDAGNGNTAVITGIVSPESFGIVGDWDGVSGTDNTNAYLAYDTYCLNNGLQQNWKSGKYYFATMGLPVSVDMKGNRDVEMYFKPDITVSLKNCLLLAEDVVIKRITTYPSETNATRTYFNNDFVDNFDYHTNYAGFGLSTDSTIIDCKSKGSARGCTAVQNSKNVTIVRGLYQGGVWGVSIYNCSVITMDNVTVHGGTDGGMAMPSCKRVNVVGGFVYNPGGTGVNTGGSSAVGFNAENITVTGVQIFARDCVNLENGCEHAVVTGNICDVLSLSTSDGVGIGIHTRSGGGLVGDIVISGNSIDSSYGTYATAIKTGDLDAGFDTYGICIGPNRARNCRQGILLENQNTGKKNYDFEISGGNYKCFDRGLSLYGEHEAGKVNGGIYTRNSPTTTSSTYGMELGSLTKVDIDGVTTKGWFPHIRQVGAPTSARVANHIFQAGDDNANFVKLDNQTGGGGIPITEATPISSITAAPLGTGQVAVVGGVSYIAVGKSSTADWKQTSNP